METVSSSQDKSKLVSVFMPMMPKEATKEKLAILNACRPDNNADQSVWRLGIEISAEKILNRIKITLRNDEEKCGLFIEGNRDTRKMIVTAVENRLKEVKKVHMKSSQKSIENFTVKTCNTHPTSCSLSSNSKRKSPLSSSSKSSKMSKH